MTLYEFNLLPTDKDKYYVIFNNGVFIHSINENEKKYVLYAINKFFVEVEYNSGLNEIQNFTSFKTGELLNKHFKKIKLIDKD